MEGGDKWEERPGSAKERVGDRVTERATEYASSGLSVRHMASE